MCSLMALGGCGALKLAYGQMPQLVYWWLDGYLDFNDAQTARVKASLAETLRWHRATQLPDHIALLQRARAEVVEPVTPAQVCRWYDDVVQRLDTSFEHFLPTLAEIVPTVSPAQIAHLEKKYEKNTEKFADDYLQPDPARRLKAAIKRSVDNAEKLYGSLEKPQLERLTAEVTQSPFDPQASMAERKRLHRDIVDTLRKLRAEAATTAQAQVALRALVQRARVSTNEEQRAYQQRLTQYNCEFAAKVHNVASPEQRQRAAKTLKGYEDDLRSLLAG